MKRHVEVSSRSPSLLQRQADQSSCSCGGKCTKCKGSLQRSAISTQEAGDAPPIVHQALDRPGRALDAATRDYFEPRLGQDFSAVRVHTDALAAQSARAVSARAYTVGNDVVFDEGRFAPHSITGRQLLAHELAHVAQQRSGSVSPAGDGLRIGAANDAHEFAADKAADAVINGRSANVGAAPAGVLRRAPGDPPFIPSPVLQLKQAVINVEVEESEAVSKDNPKLVQVAQSYKANPSARVRLSASLTEGAKNSSAQAATERGKLNSRMRSIREALKALGVPDDAIDLSSATSYSTAARGQVGIDVSKSVMANPFAEPPLATPATLPPQVPAQAPASGLPSLNLDVTFGPVTISLPKEVRAKLPIALSRSKRLVIELAYEVPAKFSFKMTLDGTPYVRVSLKAGVEVDTKSGGSTGSAGLVIESVATTCNAQDPGETREKLKTAGDKLNKAAKEYSEAAADDKLGKAFDIASAIGEMYDAVDKAKASCKQVPRATVEFGYKRPLSPGTETDPLKQPAEYIGVTGTFKF